MMDGKFIMNPYVGDIQLHAFSSYLQNQVRLEIGHSVVEQNKKNVTLWVRGELTPPYDILRQQATLHHLSRRLVQSQTFRSKTLLPALTQ